MARILARLAGILSVLALAPAASATTINEVQFSCSVSSQQRIDPLVDYGVNPTAHLHSQGGASVFSATETIGDMLGAPSTSCPLSADRTEFWFPTPLKPDGTPATVNHIQWWETNTGYQLPTTESGVAAFDPGLRFVAGDHTCARQTCDTMIYECRNGLSNNNVPQIPAAGQCGSNNAGYLAIKYDIKSQCWDGQSQGEGFGSPDPPVVPGVNIVQGTGGVCPAGFQPIPGFTVALQVANDGMGGCLSSDIANAGAPPGSPCSVLGTISPGSSGHMDIALGLSRADQAAIDQHCLNPVFPTTQGAFTACRMRVTGRQGPGLYAFDPADGWYDIFVTPS